MEPSTEPTTESEPRKSGTWCWFARWLRPEGSTESRSTFATISQSALDAADAGDSAVTGHGSMYRAGLTLAELRPGECGYVCKLFGPTLGRLRLLEMGLTPGTHIKLVRAAAFGGPIDILVRGYQLSLRREEAAGVWLDDPDEDADADDALPVTVSHHHSGGEGV